MKRIGLLTFSSNSNYGSWCLTYALYKAINDLGYDIEVINYYFAECEEKERLTVRSTIRLLKNWDGGKEDIEAIRQKWRIQKGFDREKKRFWKVSKNRYMPHNIERANSKYDIFLIGSDLVWDHRFGGKSNNFFLDFAKDNKIKVAFSASSGYTAISFGDKEEKEFNRFLAGFDYIAVREPNLKQMLRGIYPNNIPVVCDPTMLLKNTEWERFVHANTETKPYVLLYIVDSPRMFEIARHYAKKKGKEVLYIGDASPNKCIQIRRPSSVADWISLIYHSDRVFTGSYHGLLFSIYFRKEFSFYFRSPLSRFSNLVEQLRLKEYDIDFVNFDLERRVNWKVVKQAEEKFRLFSKDALMEMLSVIDEKTYC